MGGHLEGAAALMSRMPGLTRVPACYLAALLSRPGRIVTYDTLSAGHEMITGRAASNEAIRRAMTNARRAIDAAGERIVILPAPGVGYSAMWESPDISVISQTFHDRLTGGA